MFHADKMLYLDIALIHSNKIQRSNMIINHIPALNYISMGPADLLERRFFIKNIIRHR